jgi:transcriptional regulator with XRE-family HTH domain
MSSKNNIIDVITAKIGLKQLEIAEKIGVSRAQVSKWRSGEDIPPNRRKALNEMAGLFGDDVEWSLLTKTPENAENWIKYFSEYHDSYLDVDPCSNLSDSPEIWVPSMLTLFDKIGIKIPETAPDTDSEDTEDTEGTEDTQDFETLVREYLESYAALINYYNANICMLSDIDDDILEDSFEIESCILDFAITHVDKDNLDKLGADYSKVTSTAAEARDNISRIIRKIVSIMVSKNIPIMTDYFDLINKQPYDLDDEQMFSSIGDNTINSMLPLYERTVLEQNKLLVQLLTELHIKIDMLIKPEDREKLSSILEYTPPLRNKHILEDSKGLSE